MIRSFFAFIVAVVFMILPGGLMAEQPQVTNVTAAQRDDGSGLVDIRYRLSDASSPVTVSVRVSPDGGSTWQGVSSVTGDVGPGIDNGTRSIVWHAGADVPDIHWPDARIEITTTTPTPTPTPAPTPSPGDCGGEGEIMIMLPGDVPLCMVTIPAGSFVMGSPPNERGRLWVEGPQTNVTLTRDFYMGKFPVTQAQWQAVMGNNPSMFSGRPDNPVEMVNWQDAQEFITALNAHIASTGQGPATMRLPTEAEWEYACRAGTTTRFYIGNSLLEEDSCLDDGIRGQYMWFCPNSGEQTNPVGQKLPNDFGLYDMHGNVWEWIEDWYHDTYPGGSVTDPTGPSESTAWGLLRGGSWRNWARTCRSAERNSASRTVRFSNKGFRLASFR